MSAHDRVMRAGEIQERQVRNRLEEARDFIDGGSDLIEEARVMSENGRAAALRTALSKLRDVYLELGRIADGEPPVPRVHENGGPPDTECVTPGADDREVTT